MTEPEDVTRIGFHFDVMCPWAYQTSKWIRTVRDQTGLEIDWRFFSLEEINRDEGKKHPWEREWSYGWGMLRVAAMLRRDSMDACDRFYEAAGRALHEDGRKPHVPEVAKELLTELGLDPGTVDAAIADQSTHDEVKADHDAVVNAGGFGVPTLVFGEGSEESMVYGPVVVPAPEGDDALALWELTCAYQRVPFLYEIKTPKTDRDMSHIGAVFEPYINARDWESREKPAR
ncbi:MAG: DsbA family protein [Acidobacteria bacterium]|nr:DsbA family protein [Acidobacteriota bacterium]